MNKIIVQFMTALKIAVPPMITFRNSSSSEFKLEDQLSSANEVCFNKTLFRGLSIKYGLLIALHEIYHFSVQSIVHKNDVIVMRDNRRWDLMQLCDVEADVEVISFLKEKEIIKSWGEYLNILFSGVTTFRDQIMRLPKLERFIGTSVSVKTLFDTGKKVLLLPFLFYGAVLLFSVDFDSRHLNVKPINPDEIHLDKWSAIYQNSNPVKAEQYQEMMSALSGMFQIATNKNLLYA